MALIDRKIPKGAVANQEADTDRTVDIPQKKVRKKLSPVERKNIKVSPETFDLIKTIATMKSYKNYEFIDIAVESYIKNNLTEREQRILKNLTPK
jgi:hypothetical protein